MHGAETRIASCAPKRRSLRRLVGGAILLLCGAISGLAHAQHALGFNVDGGVASYRDDLLVPRALSGPRLGLGVTYAGMLGPGTLHVHLQLAAAVGIDRDAYLGLVLDHALGADYVFDLGLRRGGPRLALGPSLGIDTDVLGVSDWDDSHAYWLALRWIGLTLRATTPAWRGSRWDLTVELPLFGLLSRPPVYRMNQMDALDEPSFYIFDVQRDPKPVWLPDVQQLRVAVDLWRDASAGLVARGWAVGAEARIVHAADPRSAFAFRTTLRFSAVWEL
jgi:hypothetical protein